MENKFIHALDISLSCTGITIFSDDGKWIETTSIETSPKETHAARLKFIGNKLIEIRKKYPCSLFVCEQGFSRFSASTEAIFKCVGIAQYIYYDIEQIFYPPATVKKVITGKGNSKKEEVESVIKLNYPSINFENNDQSDSFAVMITHMLKSGVIKKWKN